MVFGVLMALGRRFVRRGSLRLLLDDRPPIDLGDGTGPRVVVEVQDPAALIKFLRSPNLASGETYMNGAWALREGRLTDLLDLLLENEALLADSLPYKLYMRLRRWYGWLQERNDPTRSRRNASHHYDIGNDLYAAFLDEGMNYSCAFFERPTDTLRAAQRHKLRLTIDRLEIPEGARVLDIGCGWGELSREICRRHPTAQVVGITLADEQYQLAMARASTSYDNRLGYALEDYRDHALDHAGTYDRIVSIGMAEHVGEGQFDQYFAAIVRMLRSGGRALIHSIVKPAPGKTSDWINKYIFPGGYIPMLNELIAAGEAAGLEVAAEPFRHDSFHYAETLRRWQQNFAAAYPRLDHTKYDERFHRMWTFYLAGAEAAFNINGMFVAQTPYRKP